MLLYCDNAHSLVYFVLNNQKTTLSLNADDQGTHAQLIGDVDDVWPKDVDSVWPKVIFHALTKDSYITNVINYREMLLTCTRLWHVAFVVSHGSSPRVSNLLLFRVLRHKTIVLLTREWAALTSRHSRDVDPMWVHWAHIGSTSRGLLSFYVRPWPTFYII